MNPAAQAQVKVLIPLIHVPLLAHGLLAQLSISAMEMMFNGEGVPISPVANMAQVRLIYMHNSA